MSIYIVWNNVVFEETAVGISDALFISGFDAKIQKNNDFFDDSLYIMMGLHRFNLNDKLPKNFIAIQSEQLGSKWITKDYLSVLSRARVVWDFSDRNIQYFNKSLSIPCRDIGTRVPMDVFYPDSPSMKRHFSGRQKDIDILFYGARCPRRESMELKFKKNGFNTVFRYYDLFREERDDLISRSKVVLNIHYYIPSSLETHRIEYLCSRGKCVISENSSDVILDKKFTQSILFSSTENMVKLATKFVNDEKARSFMEECAQKHSMSRQSNTRVLVESLREVAL